MRFLQRSKSKSGFFVTLLLLTYKTYGSSMESDQITINDHYDPPTNENRAKLKAFIARSFANGKKLDLLDHNAWITQYHQIVNSSAILFAKQLLMQKSIANKNIRYVNEKYINHFFNCIQNFTSGIFS